MPLITRPYFAPTPTCTGPSADCTWFSYDQLGRVIREDRPRRGATTTGFAGSAGAVAVTVTETVKHPGGADQAHTKQSRFNVLGQLVSTTDAHGTADAITTTYDYDAHGNLDAVEVDGTLIASLSYNATGRRRRSPRIKKSLRQRAPSKSRICYTQWMKLSICSIPT